MKNNPTREQEKKKKGRTEIQKKDQTQKYKTHNGELEEEKTRNLGPNCITNSTKQVVRGDGQKSQKDTKPRKGLFCCHNYPTQDNGNLNFLKSR